MESKQGLGSSEIGLFTQLSHSGFPDVIRFCLSPQEQEGHLSHQGELSPTFRGTKESRAPAPAASQVTVVRNNHQATYSDIDGWSALGRSSKKMLNACLLQASSSICRQLSQGQRDVDKDVYCGFDSKSKKTLETTQKRELLNYGAEFSTVGAMMWKDLQDILQGEEKKK